MNRYAKMYKIQIQRCPGTGRGMCGYPLKTEADLVHGRCEDCWDEIQAERIRG